MARIGFYPGTFDPITNGHIDIIKRAVRLVDQLVIGVALNANKNPLWSLDERVQCIHEALFDALDMDSKKPDHNGCQIRVVGFDNLLVDCARKHNADMIIRGLRQSTDFDYEYQMCLMNQRLDPEIETVFLVATEQNRSIASSFVKEVALLGGNISSFVPESTLKRFQKMLKSNENT